MSINGVIEETSINPARVLFLIGSLYSLTLFIDKVFEYFMYFIHPGRLMLTTEKKNFIEKGFKPFDPDLDEDEEEIEQSNTISYMS